jgi:hypothetical protein
MKKIILVALTLVTFTINAQTCCQKDTTAKIGYYASLGLSVSNSGSSNFESTSYPSMEFGITKNNFGTGLAFGRSNLSGFSSDVASNYWYEIKTSLSVPIQKFTGYGLLGIGNYITTRTIFVEYGIGFSYAVGSISIFTQASNWDGLWYVTPGFSYNF